MTNILHNTETPSQRARKVARATAGDLSSSTVGQLSALYDACECAAAVWLGAVNQPRAGYDGEDSNVLRIMEDEQDRLFYIQEAIADSSCLESCAQAGGSSTHCNSVCSRSLKKCKANAYQPLDYPKR
jgi:hypothetical protein